jgi:hypothetical protein
MSSEDESENQFDSKQIVVRKSMNKPQSKKSSRTGHKTTNSPGSSALQVTPASMRLSVYDFNERCFCVQEMQQRLLAVSQELTDAKAESDLLR